MDILIAIGADLDRLAAMYLLTRGVGETDESLRRRVLAVLPGMRAPAPPPDLVHTITLTDRAGRQYVVDVEVRTQYIAECLGYYARTNAHKLSKACDGGVIVRFVREVQP